MKSAAKKGKKRKGRRGPSRAGHPRFQVIRIVGLDPKPLEVGTNGKKFLSWANEDNRDYWIKFIGGWPFYGAQGLIEVPAQQPSIWFKVAMNVAPGNSRIFKYAIKLDPSDPDPPPDGPGVIVDGG